MKNRKEEKKLSTTHLYLLVRLSGFVIGHVIGFMHYKYLDLEYQLVVNNEKI